MKIITFILFAFSISSYGQDHSRALANLHEQEYLQKLITSGIKNFYVLEKTSYGSLYRGKNDSCKFRPRESFIFIQRKDDQKDFDVILFDECGKQWSLKLKSEAIDYYIQEESEILKKRFDYETMINHVWRLYFYEIKNGEIYTESTFCDTEIQLEQNKEMREYNEGLKLYKFFSLLTTEIGLLKNAR